MVSFCAYVRIMTIADERKKRQKGIILWRRGKRADIPADGF